MASRRRGLNASPFERDAAPPAQIDAELFGDLARVGRPVALALPNIRLDGGTQPRAALDQELIAEYAEAIREGAVFPPGDAFYDGSSYWLADGFHRWHGHDLASKATMDVIIHQGTQRDAVLFSVGVNAEHGKRRTNEDKRRAVMVLLRDPEWSQWAAREIARQCKVSHQLVNNLRAELSGNNCQMGTDEPEARVVRRGEQVYEQRVSSEKRSQAQQAVRETGPQIRHGVGFDAEPMARFETMSGSDVDDQAAGEAVPVLAALQDLIGAAITAVTELEKVRAGAHGGVVLDAEATTALLDLVAEALDRCNGYEVRGEWAIGVIDLLEWVLEDWR